MSCIALDFIFFTRILGRVQFRQDTKAVKKSVGKGGKPEIFDFVCAPLPGRLERCGAETFLSMKSNKNPLKTSQCKDQFHRT